MTQHPEIVPSFKKEIQFFDGGLSVNEDVYLNGVDWYRSFFPLKRRLKNHKITCEASPNYILNPVVAKRIKNTLPAVKLILVMRNPTERAISHYFHMVRKNIEMLDPLEAMKSEESRLKEILKEERFREKEFRRFSYKLRGKYKEQLDRYLNYFDKAQILCISSEDLFKNQEKVLAKAFRFVGVSDKVKIKDLRPKNVGLNRKKVSDETYEYLNEYFRSYNEELFAFLGERFDW